MKSLQYFDHDIVLKNNSPHPCVTACDWVFLTDTFALFPVEEVSRAVLLIPSLHPESDRHPPKKEWKTASRNRPTFFSVKPVR